MPRTPGNPYRAFTLVELMTTMLIMVVVMGGLTSALVLAAHALPGGQRTTQTRTRVSEALDGWAAELLYATSVTENSGNAVTFTVADRNHGDPGPETIRYAWAGTKGDPLTRQYNGGTTVVVLENVILFEMEYDILPESRELTGLRVHLVVGGRPDVHVLTCAQTLNYPEVL